MSKHIVAILMVIIFEAYMTHGLLHVCVHVYMAYMCEGVGERVCWFDEAIGGMLVEMNLGSGGVRLARDQESGMLVRVM